MWYVQNQSRLTKLFRMQREILNIQSVLVTHKLVDQDDIVARIGVAAAQNFRNGSPRTVIHE